jgi:hypothetical protein
MDIHHDPQAYPDDEGNLWEYLHAQTGHADWKRVKTPTIVELPDEQAVVHQWTIIGEGTMGQPSVLMVRWDEETKEWKTQTRSKLGIEYHLETLQRLTADTLGALPDLTEIYQEIDGLRNVITGQKAALRAREKKITDLNAEKASLQQETTKLKQTLLHNERTSILEKIEEQYATRVLKLRSRIAMAAAVVLGAVLAWEQAAQWFGNDTKRTTSDLAVAQNPDDFRVEGREWPREEQVNALVDAPFQPEPAHKNAASESYVLHDGITQQELLKLGVKFDEYGMRHHSNSFTTHTEARRKGTDIVLIARDKSAMREDFTLLRPDGTAKIEYRYQVPEPKPGKKRLIKKGGLPKEVAKRVTWQGVTPEELAQYGVEIGEFDDEDGRRWPAVVCHWHTEDKHVEYEYGYKGIGYFNEWSLTIRKAEGSENLLLEFAVQDGSKQGFILESQGKTVTSFRSWESKPKEDAHQKANREDQKALDGNDVKFRPAELINRAGSVERRPWYYNHVSGYRDEPGIPSSGGRPKNADMERDRGSPLDESSPAPAKPSTKDDARESETPLQRLNREHLEVINGSYRGDPGVSRARIAEEIQKALDQASLYRVKPAAPKATRPSAEPPRRTDITNDKLP